MRDFSQEPGFENLQEIAKRLEKVAKATNDALLKGANIEPGKVLEVVAETQAKMLRLDDHGKRRFVEALEEKRVRTFAQDSLVMTCVLSSAVALREFKNQPRRVDHSLFAAPLTRLREKSTTGLGLGAFALATFYAVVGRGVTRHLKNKARGRTIRA